MNTTDGRHLSRLLVEAASKNPDHCAVEDEHGREMTYSELASRADRVSARLSRWGVGRGDRIGVWLPKSLESVAAIHGILRAGAAYVPVDPTGPALRGAMIFANSGVKAVIVASELKSALCQAWPGPAPRPRLIVVPAMSPESAKAHEDNAEPGHAPSGIQDGAEEASTMDALWDDVISDDIPSPLPPPRDENDLAYVLFTSGSTGQPKGVMLTHANAFTFIDWCLDALGPWRDGDRFSSHAPFHFDLSIFDLYVACRNAGTLVLIGETLGKEPGPLGAYLIERRISVWYSAPSILSLMVNQGVLETARGAGPRLVLFAGEVFPIAPLRKLRALWPHADLWNLYGPTETNVCTAYKVPSRVPDEQTRPFPIGQVCPPLRARVVDEEGRDVEVGAQGELIIAGPGVMRGYFGNPDLTERAFFSDEAGTRWYRTGDLVIDDGTGCFAFHGRRDRMVKKRGYRIELGEIESALYRHEGVDRAAVLANADDQGVAITAFIAMKPDRKKSIIAMKRHCAVHLPNYMVPDSITFLNTLPSTSTDKVDYQRLKAIGTVVTS